jgi:cytochrome c peroxidase
MKKLAIVAAAAALVIVVVAQQKKGAKQESTSPWPQAPGYADMTYPADNPMTKEKVELGRLLFFDKRLSGDESRSCYSCHLKEFGLTDGKPTAIGAYEVKLPRASPTLWNIGYHSEFYWDGRSRSLELQAVAAWTGGNMGVTGKDGRPSASDICKKLMAIPAYASRFQKVFGAPCTPERVGQAIAAYERTIVSDRGAWFRFRAGQTNALSQAARRGWKIFSEKAKCTNCHDGVLLTDLQYHNVGIGMDKEKPDLGRAVASKDEKDTGAFKTPTLLDIAKSAPYFHDGSVATLEEAVELMTSGGKPNKWLDVTNLKDAKEANLTKAEKADLLAFLRSLNVETVLAEPKLP